MIHIDVCMYILFISDKEKGDTYTEKAELEK